MATQFIEQPLHTQDFVELESRYGAHNYHPLDVVIERAASGCMTSKANATSIACLRIPQ
jgi:ornithine--oxo-acid transaminase